MTTLEVGKKLVELCKQGKNQEAMDTLYAPDIVSVEAALFTVKDGKIVREEFFYVTG